MAEMEPLTRQEMILDGMDIEPITRLEYFLKKAKQGGGGGSSLPPYTSADKGKVLTVGETLLPVIVIPEQTITAESGQPVPVTDYDDAFFSSAAQGDKITATYNGNTAELTATVDHDILTFAGGVGVPILVLYVPDGDAPGGMAEGVYLVGAPDTYTITASAAGSVPSVEPKWEANAGLFVVNIGGTPQAPTADKTYSEITAAVNTGKIPIAVANGGTMILSYNGQTGTKYGFSLANAQISGADITAIAFYSLTIANDDTVEMIFGTHGFS